jgi:hypothetical protein
VKCERVKRRNGIKKIVYKMRAAWLGQIANMTRLSMLIAVDMTKKQLASVTPSVNGRKSYTEENKIH